MVDRWASQWQITKLFFSGDGARELMLVQGELDRALSDLQLDLLLDLRSTCARIVSAVSNGKGKALASVALIPSSDLYLGELLGRGSFGEVFEAQNTVSRQKVAVKKLVLELPAAAREAATPELLREAVIHASLASAGPYVLPLLGVCLDAPAPWLVLELAKHGSLQALLAKRRTEGRGPLPLCMALAAGWQVNRGHSGCLKKSIV